MLFIHKVHAAGSFTGVNRLNTESTLVYEPYLAPDTVPIMEEGDTLSYFVDGLDTIYLLYQDTTLASADTLSDSSDIELRLVDYTKDIVIDPGNAPLEVNDNLFGVHIEGIFTPKHMPMDVDNINYSDVQNWLADLHPQVLRFPGGASSRWMHLLPYDTDGDGIDDVFPKGYGYDIDELIRFHDVTDGDFQVDNFTLLGEIKDDLQDGSDNCETCATWAGPGYDVSIQKFADDYYEQESHVYSGESIRYIDQFVELVNYIQDRENYTIDVIVDLNVISESASQCKRIVEYLRDNGVNVVGVEFGNECNLSWATDFLGFHQFDDYYFLMNGNTPTDLPDISVSEEFETWLSTLYADVFNEIYQNDHDFFEVFKNDAAFSCLVGLPAANLPSHTPQYAFKDTESMSVSWNEDMTAHYGDFHIVDGDIQYYFDAVVLHPYYDAASNWGDIALNQFCLAYYPNSGLPICNEEACDIWETDKWQYAINDERLKPPFEHVLGLGVNDFGNFRQFIKTRYDQSYDLQNIDLKLYLAETDPSHKELWTTEWNLKDKNPAYNDDDIEQIILTSYCNTLAHGLLIQEWFLKDIKKNFDEDFRIGFHTYSTFHALGGGNYYALLLHADKADRLNHRDEDAPGEPLDPLPAPPGDQKLWLKRTVYQGQLLLSEINKRNLKYLPSDFGEYLLNPNIQPTLFLQQTATENNLLIYFSNMKHEKQTYILRLGHLATMFPGANAIGYGTPQIYSVAAIRLFSSSGRNMLFDLNICYDDENHLHPFEIQDTTGPSATYVPECTGLPGGAICITVPANSFGYIVVPIYTSPRMGDTSNMTYMTLYPNPASNQLHINLSFNYLSNETRFVKIYDMNGALISEYEITTDLSIRTDQLAAGIYNVILFSSYGEKIASQTFVKSE